MKNRKQILIIVLTVLLVAIPVAAQTDDASPEMAGEAEGVDTLTITGQIVNGTYGAETPGILIGMLHVLDANFNGRDMVHGVADASGRFVFDDVPYESGWFYSMMATYQDTNYSSIPIEVAEQDTILELEVSVYESTTDISAAQIDTMHILFNPDQQGLLVSEVYSLSNLGDRTIAGAVAMDDGTPATFLFELPAAATNVNFEGSQSRFFLTSGGFVDRAPLIPGELPSQIVVTYVLPYEDGLELSRVAALPISDFNVMLPPELGLSLDSDSLIDDGLRDMGNGIIVDVYSGTNLAAGEEIRLDLFGELAVPGYDPMAAKARSTNSSGLAIGGVFLGLVIIGVGLWWYRRPTDELEEEPQEEFERIVEEIALLDFAHEQLEIDDDVHQQKRMALQAQARSLLAQTGG